MKGGGGAGRLKMASAHQREAGQSPTAVSPEGAVRLLWLPHSAALRLRCCAEFIPRDGTACSGMGSQAGAPARHKSSKLNGRGRI